MNKDLAIGAGKAQGSIYCRATGSRFRGQRNCHLLLFEGRQYKMSDHFRIQVAIGVPTGAVGLEFDADGIGGWRLGASLGIGLGRRGTLWYGSLRCRG